MKNADVDAYIAEAPPFARPILKKIRDAFHRGCPDLEERLKWGVPSFEYRGLMGGAAAFKAHVAWGFWRQKEMDDPHKIFKGEGMMGGGKITDVAELPDDRVIVQYVKAACRLNEQGPMKRPKTKPKPDAKVPADLAAALRKNRKASAVFAEFPPSHRREYVEWITEAKRDETRAKRLATAIEWMAKGKSRNWKYEKC